MDETQIESIEDAVELLRQMADDPIMGCTSAPVCIEYVENRVTDYER